MQLGSKEKKSIGAPLPWVPAVSAEMSTDTWSSRQEELFKKQERLRQEQQELEQCLRQEQQELEQQRRAMLQKQEADKVRQQNLRTDLRYTCDAAIDGSKSNRVLNRIRQFPEARWYISPFCPYRTHAPADQPQVIIEDAVYEITFTIPGLRKGDLRISVEGGALHFVGQTTTDDFDVGISRAVRLPADADLASAIKDTTHADGIIKTRVPRVKLRAQPKQTAEPIHPAKPTSGAASAAPSPSAAGAAPATAESVADSEAAEVEAAVVEAAVVEAVSAMKLRDIKTELARRDIPSVGFLEKSEFVQALIAARLTSPVEKPMESSSTEDDDDDVIQGETRNMKKPGAPGGIFGFDVLGDGPSGHGSIFGKGGMGGMPGAGSTAGGGAPPFVFSFAPGTQEPSPPDASRRQQRWPRNSVKNVHGVNGGAPFSVPRNPFHTTDPFASSSSASGIDWSKGDVGWSTWNVRRLRPLRDFTQETLQQQIVSNIERAGGYKIFIPSPGVHKTHTYRIDACTFTTHNYVHDTDPRTIVDMTTSGVLYVDSGPAIELFGADYTSANVRITHQDGFVIVFIPLKDSRTSLFSGGPDLGLFGASASPSNPFAVKPVGGSPFGGGFGGAAGGFGVGGSTGTGAPPFRDSIERESASGGVTATLHYKSISKMQEYAHKSFEELR